MIFIVIWQVRRKLQVFKIYAYKKISVFRIEWQNHKCNFMFFELIDV